ncbi:MAG: threonine ammonia-lyase [Burkholderiales bacterium]
MTNDNWGMSPPVFSEIEAAALCIAPVAIVTPLLDSPVVNERVGGRVLVKAEGLQRTGSFKIRGAYNRMAQLSDNERSNGVVAYSSGNHGQAVAAAARLLGTTAVIVMPADAPQAKIVKTKAFGAEVVLYDRYREDRVAIGEKVAIERGLVLVPPYEDRRIIAGAGTLGREIAMQADAMGARLDALLVCCSGGGLTAGCALALEALSPETAVIAVEPVGFDDTGRSLAAGERVSNESGARSICDALLVETPGLLSFAINRRLVSGAVAVTDDEAVEAMATAFREFGVVVEPSGAIALAAILSGRYDARDKTVVATITGSNVDIDTATELMTSRLRLRATM